MKKISSLTDLLMEELADLLNGENQLINALPAIAEASESAGLKRVLVGHVEVSKEHVYRLQDIFDNLGQGCQEANCKAMKRLIDETTEIIKRTSISGARDAAIIGVVQRMERYEITGYGIAREHAEDLGHTRIMELVETTLNEERSMNLHLSELAQSMINIQAILSESSVQKDKNKGKTFLLSARRIKENGIKKLKGMKVSRFMDEGDSPKQKDGGKT